MTRHRSLLVLIVLAGWVLAGCVDVRRPLAESEVDADGGDDDPAGGDGDPMGAGRSADDPAAAGPDGGVGAGGASSGVAGDGRATGPDGGAAIDPMTVLPDGTFGGEGAMGWGGAGGAEPWGMAGAGGDSCGCDDGDPCTIDHCNADGTCVRESVATMTDRDGDTVSDGCDCDDQNPDVYPGQSQFFAEPHGEDPAIGIPGYDYDCDGYAMQLLTSEARTCERYAGLDVCFGDGWLIGPDRLLPDCGNGAAYQACEFREGTCEANVLMMVQRCR
jgi:hypothetical protein